MHNLASRMLAMLLRTVSNDFEEQHGFRPVLVDTGQARVRLQGSAVRPGPSS